MVRIGISSIRSATRGALDLLRAKPAGHPTHEDDGASDTSTSGAVGGGESARSAAPQQSLPRGSAGWVAAVGMALGHPPVYRRVRRVLAVTPEDDVLEVGCGSAGLLAGLAPHVRHVAGIDLSEVQVRLARRRLARRIAAGSAEVVLGDVAALPWPEGRFSAVVWLWGLETLIGDPQRALAEIRRVLRPEGRAVLSVGALVDEDTARGELTKLPGFWRWTEARAREELARAGFGDLTFHEIVVGGRLYNRMNRATVGFDTIRLVVARCG